jgi:hypothetical protein
MATYIANPGDFAAPFDPGVKNAVLPFKHYSLYVAMPNTSTNNETTNKYPTEKSLEPTPNRFQHTPIALTPEQESAVISLSVIIANQERLQRSNASPNNGSTDPNEHESTKKGRSHSFLKASYNINCNTKAKTTSPAGPPSLSSSQEGEAIHLTPTKRLQRRNA